MCYDRQDKMIKFGCHALLRKGGGTVKRKFGCLAVGLLLALILSGCRMSLFKSAEDLYAQPQLPEGYENLNTTIQTIVNAGDVEQAAPQSGSNTSAVQLLDLDGDGTEETAVAFFRSSSADDPKPLKIYLLRTGNDGAYNIAYKLEGEGTSVNSIAYQDLTGDGNKEVVVSWQLTTRANVLSVYELGPMGAVELAHTTYNESYVLADLNRDGRRELIVIQRDDTGSERSQASCYTYEDGMLVLTSSANLSEGVLDVTSVRTGVLAGHTPAIYVTSKRESGQVTDIFAYEDGGLVNVTLNPDSGVSNDTLRDYEAVGITDINNDGVLEVPAAQMLPALGANSAAHWVIYWRQFDRNGSATVACITYHAVNDGWYIVLPSDWAGRISAERNTEESYRGEWSVTFYHWDDDGVAAPFMTVFRLTGNNREVRARKDGREPILSTNTATFAVKFMKEGWDCGLSTDRLKERFSLITTEWSNDDT